jgi:hypothetical protein
MAQLTLTDISKRFGVNRTTIYRAVNSGKISRLDNGMFDLAEVIRVFGEPAQQQTTPPPASNANDRELIAALKSQVDLLTKQLEKKDAQIDFLQNRIETSQQRHNATPSNDSQQQSETPIDKGMQHDEAPYEANSNDTKQHGATSLIGRFGRGLKAFLK